MDTDGKMENPKKMSARGPDWEIDKSTGLWLVAGSSVPHYADSGKALEDFIHWSNGAGHIATVHTAGGQAYFGRLSPVRDEAIYVGGEWACFVCGLVSLRGVISAYVYQPPLAGEVESAWLERTGFRAWDWEEQ